MRTLLFGAPLPPLFLVIGHAVPNATTLPACCPGLEVLESHSPSRGRPLRVVVLAVGPDVAAVVRVVVVLGVVVILGHEGVGRVLALRPAALLLASKVCSTISWPATGEGVACLLVNSRVLRDKFVGIVVESCLSLSRCPDHRTSSQQMKTTVLLGEVPKGNLAFHALLVTRRGSMNGASGFRQRSKCRKKLGPLGLRLLERLTGPALHIAQGLDLSKLETEDGANCFEVLTTQLQPRRDQQAKVYEAVGP